MATSGHFHWPPMGNSYWPLTPETHAIFQYLEAHRGNRAVGRDARTVREPTNRRLRGFSCLQILRTSATPGCATEGSSTTASSAVPVVFYDRRAPRAEYLFRPELVVRRSTTEAPQGTRVEQLALAEPGRSSPDGLTLAPASHGNENPNGLLRQNFTRAPILDRSTVTDLSQRRHRTQQAAARANAALLHSELVLRRSLEAAPLRGAAASVSRS